MGDLDKKKPLDKFQFACKDKNSQMAVDHNQQCHVLSSKIELLS